MRFWFLRIELWLQLQVKLSNLLPGSSIGEPPWVGPRFAGSSDCVFHDGCNGRSTHGFVPHVPR